MSSRSKNLFNKSLVMRLCRNNSRLAENNSGKKKQTTGTMGPCPKTIELRDTDRSNEISGANHLIAIVIVAAIWRIEFKLETP